MSRASPEAAYHRPRGRSAMIRVTPSISIAERELEEHFIRAPGPGGQNVNKLASAVELRFDVRRSPSLPEDVRARLVDLIRRAAVAPVARRATKPTAGSREQRLESKKRRSTIKSLRRTKPGLD